MIYLSAYDTTACNSILMHKTEEALQAAMINGWLSAAVSADKVNEEFGVVSSDFDNNRNDPVADNVVCLRKESSLGSVEVPSFAHPFVLTVKRDHKEKHYTVFDARLFGRYNQQSYSFQLRDIGGYRTALTRARLNSIWVHENTSLLRDISDLPVALFASWISECVARSFALDPSEQMKLCIAAGIFYYSNFSNEEALNDREALRIVTNLTKALRVASSDVLEVLEAKPTFKSVADFCASAEAITGSIRLKEFNPGLLYSILGGTWLAPNGRETVAIALEHPPTWISIVIAALQEKGYKNSYITKMTERSSYRNSGENFLRSVAKLLEIAIAK